MDTASHIMIGVGLAALSQIDPVVAESSTMSQAVLLGTIIGSNAPDFDYVYKLRGNGSYRRRHRGWSHSLFALPLWGISVSSFIFPFFSDISFLHLFLWTFLAVIIHVFIDLFNVYGTQAIRPFSSKWIAFDTIPLTDPYIWILHAVGFCSIPFFETGKVFSIIYLLMFLYLCFRTIYVRLTIKYLLEHFQNAKRIKLIPRATIFKWDVLIETEDDFLFGVYTQGNLVIEHTLPKIVECPDLTLNSMQDSNVSAFLSCTNYAYPFIHKRKNGSFVYWKDLRFRRKKFFPYLAVMFISSDLKSKASYTGWLYSLKQYRKVLRELEGTSNTLEKESGLKNQRDNSVHY